MELKQHIETVKKQVQRFYLRLMMATKRLSDRQLMMILAALVGLATGFMTYLFELLLHFIKQWLVSWFPVNSAGWGYLIYPALGVILATLFVKYFVKNDISEGVTRVLYAMSKNSSRLAPHNCYSPVVGGALTIGFGGSVGPEAPIVLTGSAIGSNVAQLLRLNYRNTTLLLGCGAAGALAAIFKAPISGVVFVLEILMLDITMNAIVPLLISTVAATTLVFFLKGFDPILAVDVTGAFKLNQLPFYLILAVACGFVAFYLTTVNQKIQTLFGRIKRQYVKWIVGGAIIGLLIFLFPPLYGEGYESFTDLMHGNIEELFNNTLFYRFRAVPLVIVLYLLVVMLLKVVAMSVTLSAGGIGGTFAPSLFVGAFTGGVIAYTCNTWLGMDLSLAGFALVGMAGVMSGVMNAPLTSIFLIAELSNGYELFVPLMLVSSISFAIDYYFEPDSIYTKKLRKSGQLLTHDKDRSVMVFLDLDRLMETDFTPVDQTTTLGHTVKYIADARRNIFPVLDSERHLLGVVQLDDLRADMFDTSKYSSPVMNYMIPPPDVIQRKESIDSVLEKFEQSKAWMLPVVDRDNVYMGFISKSLILAAYRKKLVEMSEE